jgi:hypothetical protein
MRPFTSPEAGVPITFSCPECGTANEVPDHLSGEPAVCPLCEATVRVPGRPLGQGITTVRRQKGPQAGPRTYTPFQWGFGIGCGLVLAFVLAGVVLGFLGLLR